MFSLDFPFKKVIKIKEGCCIDSPRLPLAETCIGSTPGNKGKESGLALESWTRQTPGLRVPRWAPDRSAKGSPRRPAAGQGAPQLRRPKTRFWYWYLASRRLAYPGGPGWRSSLLSLVVNRAFGGPGSQAQDRSSLTSSGHFPLKDVPVPTRDGEGRTRRGPELKACRGAGWGCSGPHRCYPVERQLGPRRATRVTYMSTFPLQSCHRES